MVRKILLGGLLLILLGLVILPAIAYAVGQFIIGPYEGPGGLPGFLQSIYAGLRAGYPSAIALVSAPAGVILTWVAIAAWLRRGRAATAEPG